jgi:hypothetical protein
MELVRWSSGEPKRIAAMIALVLCALLALAATGLGSSSR